MLNGICNSALNKVDYEIHSYALLSGWWTALQMPPRREINAVRSYDADRF